MRLTACCTRSSKSWNADAHAVEAELAKQFNGRHIDLARVDLDRILAAVEQAKMFARRGHQLPHFVMREEGRRAAAPVQLDHVMVAIQVLALQRQLLRQIFQILGGAPVILGDDLVAGAVIADGVAERDMEVQ